MSFRNSDDRVRLAVLARLVVVTIAAVLALPTAAYASVQFPRPSAADSLQAYGGLVLAQAQIGDRIYVGGTFTSVGYGSGTIARPYLVAFDARTGQLDPGFDPQVNGRVSALAASKDGRSLYVSGIFGSIGGCSGCGRLAKVDPATGVADPAFTPRPNSEASRIAQFGNTLYVAGWFDSIGGLSRGRVAAVNAATGAVDAGFDVPLDDIVRGMALSPDGSRLYLAGLFGTAAGVARSRFASIDTASKRLTAWDPQVGADGWDVTLSPDGATVYLATANGTVGGACANEHETILAMPAEYAGRPPRIWAQGTAPGCMWNTGDVNVLVATDDTVFAGGHLALLDDGSQVRRHLTALDATTGHSLPWAPVVADGGRGVLTMALLPAGLFIGGDMGRVAGVAHAGFALLSLDADTTAPSRPATPTVSSTRAGTVTVRWPAALDRDDANLTYRVYRDGSSTPVTTLTANSTPYAVPMLTFNDTGLAAGSSHTYKVVASDGINSSAPSLASAAVTAAAGSMAPSYLQTVLADNPLMYWRLGDLKGKGAVDETRFGDTGSYQPGVTLAAPGALAGNPAATLDGLTAAVTSAHMFWAPPAFSTEMWFKTTTRSGGKLIGFGNSRTGTSSHYDRHVYMTDGGQLVFGVYPGRVVTVTSSRAYNDGQWHYVAATLGSTGMALYADGQLVGTNANTGAESFYGWWKVGYDNLNGWPSTPSSFHFAGSVDEVAVYPTALPAAAVSAHFNAGR